jgi:5-methylcytosine-specific restriction endonuclease McrA
MTALEKVNKFENLSDKDFEEIIKNASSWNDVIINSGLKIMTRRLQKKIQKLKIDYKHLPDFYAGLYSKIGKNSKETYLELLNKYDNWDDILEELKFTSLQCLNNLKKYLDNLNINYSHIKKPKKFKKFARYTLDEILVEDSLYTNMIILKKRLINELDWKYECSGCNKSTYSNNWVSDVPIPLEIDHINGIHTDNRIENLRFLCPNCHSLTETYKGKNMRIVIEKKEQKEKEETPEDIVNDILDDIINKVEKDVKKKVYKCIDCDKNISRQNHIRCIECNDKNKFITACENRNRPSLEQLLKDVEELNYVNTGKKYGVSDNSIRKWIRKYKSYQ